MSYTIINDWCFVSGFNLEKGMSIIKDYIKYLQTNEPELEQSLWLQTEDNPLRFFHIVTYKTKKGFNRQVHSEGTENFINKLSPMIDVTSVTKTIGVILANTGFGLG